MHEARAAEQGGEEGEHTCLSQELATSRAPVGLKHRLEMLSSGADLTSRSLLGL